MRTFSYFLAAAVLPVAAFAGTAAISTADKAVQPLECATDPLDTVIATSDYGFPADLKRGSGTLEVEHNDFELDRRIPLDLMTWPNEQCGQWFLRLGADYERFDFSIHNETRLPNTLESVAGILSLDYVVNGQTGLLIETRPGIYFSHKVNSGSFDAPTHIAGAFNIFGGDKFYLVAGVSLSALSRYPVLPIGGIVWHIGDGWDLLAYAPNPRLVYRFTDHLGCYAGGEYIEGGYDTDNRGVDPAKLSGAVVSYTEIRAGGGVTWRAKPLNVDFGAGYTVWSQFDYTRAGLSFETHPAPYIGLTARLDF
jgi:hypothetical protein